MDAIRITADEVETVSIADPGEDTHVTELQAAIGCHWFDVIRCEHGIDLWVDDEGMINGSTLNRPATFLANLLGHPSPVYGSAVILGGNADTGDTAPLTPEQEARVRDLLGIPAPTETDAR
ncbi:DUF3846 domain-containing protein [Rathayibacter sp. VKM Ac-2857]|uniref:DUF3846 domain-containing protein n=1 Tax=Rathayibacter sp. VKM Ac-2857 TaxID=2739020 RepID=UPI001563D2CA|nr:DUF3846 domain-containing protein [Rathayibacter sp. VKM Ac-2857]NQX18188.1 DUF3846 domain-containing protein [Rathayibacter sp. VKM Ac-2857]